MNYVTTKDGAKIYYKDWGTGQPIMLGMCRCCFCCKRAIA